MEVDLGGVIKNCLGHVRMYHDFGSGSFAENTVRVVVSKYECLNTSPSSPKLGDREVGRHTTVRS